MNFNISEKYTLKLSWQKTLYEREGECSLINAKFSGPALSIANKISPNDHIKIDFYKQYLIFLDNVYVADFFWKNVNYKDNEVLLGDAKIKHDTELNKVPKFKDTDFILIDTSNHEDSKHFYNLTYTSYVVNEYGQLYDFRG